LIRLYDLLDAAKYSVSQFRQGNFFKTVSAWLPELGYTEDFASKVPWVGILQPASAVDAGGTMLSEHVQLTFVVIDKWAGQTNADANVMAKMKVFDELREFLQANLRYDLTSAIATDAGQGSTGKVLPILAEPQGEALVFSGSTGTLGKGEVEVSANQYYAFVLAYEIKAISKNPNKP